MTSASEAAGHLVKSAEFLAVARTCLEQGQHSAAVSNAVITGINAKDAICPALTGHTQKSENHANAESELHKVGSPAAPLANTLGRLLRLKSKAQYQSGPASGTDAAHAVEWAGRLYQGAQQILS